MLCYFQVYSKVIHLYLYMYLFLFKFFSHLGYYRILSSIPLPNFKYMFFYINKQMAYWPFVYLLLEKEMATQSSILAWRIPWTEEPGRLQSVGLQESHTTERLSTAHIFFRDVSIQVLCSFKNCVCLFVVAFIFLKQDWVREKSAM